MFCVSCARRLKSHRSSKLRAPKIALLPGGTLTKTEINCFQPTFTVLTCSLAQTTRPKCWLCGKSDHVAAGLTVQQSKCLALLSITWWALGSKARLRGLWGKVPKTLHEVFSRFCKSYGAALRKGSSKVFHEGSTKKGFVSPGAPIAPSGPDQTPLRQAPSTVPIWRRLVLLDTVVRPHPQESRR